MLLESPQSFFGINYATNRILLVGIDRDDFRVSVLGYVPASANKQSLHLPGGNAIFQLLRKLVRISRGVEGLDDHQGRGLMLAVIVAGGRMIGNDHVRTQFANLQNHPSQTFFVSPKLECFVACFRIPKILQAKKVRL